VRRLACATALLLAIPGTLLGWVGVSAGDRLVSLIHPHRRSDVLHQRDVLGIMAELDLPQEASDVILKYLRGELALAWTTE
jgi:hypothetical protein